VTPGLVAFLLALVAAYGVFLTYTAFAFGWRGIGVSPAVRRRSRRTRRTFRDFLVQAGLDRVRPVEFIAVAVVLAVVAGAFAFAIWGAALPALVVATVAATVPLAAARTRRRARQDHARDAWPRMIEEIRLQAVTLGRSIPQALLAVGSAGPEEMRPAFEAAQREWLISTDFARTLDVLKAHLADPTADAVCETLLVAHDIGGTDIDQRLRALTEDRIQDLQGRKDARSKQAGVRFARLFVLFVPFGMALVGLSIGDGRAAYRSPAGQVAILVAFALMGLCWGWASRLLRLPEEERVFVERAVEATP
jgi:tight adherence protein B